MIRAILYNSAIDVYYKMPKFGEQASFVDLESFSFPAGKALNFAKAVKTLGEEVEVFGLVSANDKDKFCRFLDDYKIRHNFLEVSNSTRINTTIYEEQSGISYHLNSKSAPVLADEVLRFNEDLLAKVSPGDFLVLSGSLPAGLDEEAYRKLIEQVKSKTENEDIKIALDTRGNPLKFGVLAQPFLIAPNEREFQDLSGGDVKGLNNIALKGKRLVDRGVENVFVTLGKDGVIALNKNNCILCTPPEVATVNSVGCGDAFLAGVVVGFEQGLAFDEIVSLAVASGSAATLNKEPGKIEFAKVEEIKKKVKIERI